MKPTIAEIHLYGTPRVGHGVIISFPDGRTLGSGKPDPALTSATATMWLAVGQIEHALRRAVHPFTERVLIHQDRNGVGYVADVHTPSGRMAYFGELIWETGPVYEIPVEAILAAAEQEDAR
jgi:hypothetical protein